MVEDFKELRVYQRAFAVSMKIFEVSKDWPPEEKILADGSDPPFVAVRLLQHCRGMV
jgi:hypothetical protein